MKFAFIFALLVSTQFAHSETIREERIKKEMIARVDLLSEKINLTKTHLKKKKVAEACAQIDEVFNLYPEHVKDIGSYMNLFKSKINKLKDESLAELITFHGLSNTCNRGSDAEYVDIKKFQKSLSKSLLKLERQKLVIENNKTNQDNSFYYQYDI